MSRRSATLLLSLGLAAETLLASALAVRANEQVVNIYSSRHYNQDQALYNAFTQRTGIKVNKIEGKDAELIERIRIEGSNSPADVLITVDAGTLWRAEQAGIFQAVRSSKLNQEIPANLRDPDGRWYGFARRVRAIVYNRADVKPSEIRTYDDLASPRFRGKLCLRSSDNIYNQSMVASRIASKGVNNTRAWLKGLMANAARPPQGNDTAQIRDVASGRCDVAVVNHYYYARLLDSKKPEDQAIVRKVGLVFPNPTQVNISGAGVVRTAPNRTNAVLFLEFLASPEGQRRFVRGTHEFPIRGTLATDATARSLGSFVADPVNIDALGKNNPQAVKLMQQVGWK
jgi:iron(III) transport system substrate-binding protein